MSSKFSAPTPARISSPCPLPKGARVKLEYPLPLPSPPKGVRVKLKNLSPKGGEGGKKGYYFTKEILRTKISVSQMIR